MNDAIRMIINPDVYSYDKMYNKKVLRSIDLDKLSSKQLHEVCLQTGCEGHRQLKGEELLNLTKKCVALRLKTPSPKQLGPYGYPLIDMQKSALVELARNLGIKVSSNMTIKQLISAISAIRDLTRVQASKSPRKSPSSPSKMTVVQLKERAKKLGCVGYSKMQKVELVRFIRVCKSKSPKKSPSPSKMTVVQLKATAKKFGCGGYSKLKKAELVRFVRVCKPKSE
jgi:hypothetical protein